MSEKNYKRKINLLNALVDFEKQTVSCKAVVEFIDPEIKIEFDENEQPLNDNVVSRSIETFNFKKGDKMPNKLKKTFERMDFDNAS